MQDIAAGSKNAGKVMRKKTPREANMPSADAANDTLVYITLDSISIFDLKPEFA